jgi:hypothetical protein
MASVKWCYWCEEPIVGEDEYLNEGHFFCDEWCYDDWVDAGRPSTEQRGEVFKWQTRVRVDSDE